MYIENYNILLLKKIKIYVEVLRYILFMGLKTQNC